MIALTLIDQDYCKNHIGHNTQLKIANGKQKSESSRMFIFEFQIHKKTKDPHTDFKVICFRPNGKGDIILESLNHQHMHKQMLEE